MFCPTTHVQPHSTMQCSTRYLNSTEMAEWYDTATALQAAKHSHHKVAACLKRSMFQQTQNMPVQVQGPKSVNTKKQKIKCSSNWRQYFYSMGTAVHIQHIFIQHTIVTKLPVVGSAIYLQGQSILTCAGSPVLNGFQSSSTLTTTDMGSCSTDI
jgi:hypothetical protein